MAFTTLLGAASSRTGATARPMALAAIVGTVALVAAIGALAPRHPVDRALEQDVVEFQRRVMPEAEAADAADASERLADRYLKALPPETRHRIHDQVRAEQRSGITGPGREAFVMRRLALYEQALQAMRKGATTPAT